MKKFTAIMLSIMLLVSGMLIFAGCGKEKPQNDTPSDHGLTGGDVVGGWTKAESPAITEDFRTVFERATSALTGSISGIDRASVPSLGKNGESSDT